MKKILAVLVLMMVGLSSVFAVGDYWLDEVYYAHKDFPDLVYTSKENVLYMVKFVENSFEELFGYHLEKEEIVSSTESQVYSNEDIPRYIKESLKGGWGYSFWRTFTLSGHHLKELSAYRMRDGSILLVKLTYKNSEEPSSKVIESAGYFDYSIY